MCLQFILNYWNMKRKENKLKDKLVCVYLFYSRVELLGISFHNHSVSLFEMSNFNYNLVIFEYKKNGIYKLTCPPAAQAAIRANCPFSLCNLFAAVVTNRTPVAPNFLFNIESR